MKIINIIQLFALAAIWGSSFIFMKIIAPVLGPIATAGFRVTIAGVLIIGYSYMIKFDPEWKKNWKHFTLIGVVNSAIPFALYSFAALHIPASYSVVLNSTSPLFGAIFGAIWLKDSLSFKKIIGVMVGAIGVAIVSRIDTHQININFSLSILACLIAAVCYAISGVYIKKFALQIKPLAIAGGSQIAAGIFLLPFIAFSPIRSEVTTFILINIFALAFLCSAVAYLLYFRLMSDVGPTKALTVTFLMPVFGMLWGHLLLNEVITIKILFGVLLILVGTQLVITNKN